ncbi:MAG: response regulator [Allosphingosinicella sp.]
MSDCLDGKLGRTRLLLVEDDSAVRRALHLLFQSQGYDVRAYRSGHGLGEDPEALCASCLIADLRLPDSDGLSLLHDLRSAGWRGAAILISGHLDEEWAERARQEGYDAVLAKPIPDKVLTKWVAQLAPLDVPSPEGGSAEAKGHSLMPRRDGRA